MLVLSSYFAFKNQEIKILSKTMNSFSRIKKLSLTNASLVAFFLLAGELNPAIAASLTFEFSGTITALFGGGRPLEELRDNSLGDSLTGSYSFDDEVTIGSNLSPLTDFSVEFAAGEVLDLDFFQQGTVDLETGAISLPSPSLPFFAPFAFSTVDDSFSFALRNTAIQGTFFAQQVDNNDVESIPEPNLIFGFITLGMGMKLASRKNKQALSSKGYTDPHHTNKKT